MNTLKEAFEDALWNGPLWNNREKLFLTVTDIWNICAQNIIPTDYQLTAIRKYIKDRYMWITDETPWS